LFTPVITFKGLRYAVEVIGRLVADYPGLHLDVYGSAKLHGDALDATLPAGYPTWVHFKGGAPQREVETVMPRYGAMLYATEWLDGFSLATAEALAGGVIVIATDHGSNSELIRHGWNGLLISSDGSHKPNLEQAEELMRCYLADPPAFADMRTRAVASVPSWDHQAGEWERAWRNLPGGI
jgi:glycosyltransferase involved in cell wall biosynthesis